MPRTPRRESRRVAVLDIGSAKIACFIAEIGPGGQIHITGVGHQLSKGIRGSVITDVADAETSVIAAVHAAEQMAGYRIDSTVVSLSGGGIASRGMMVEMALMADEVTERDILDIIEQGHASAENEDQEIVHCFPISYSLDGARGIADPRQMFGHMLGAELHAITAAGSITRNLAHCLARCHLDVEEFVLASHVSALSCLEEDEMRLGALLIDMGGSTTGFSVFSGGKNIYSDVIPLGGKHVTSDIAKGLSTTLAHAERLKTLHGSCVSTPTDEQVMISAPLLGEGQEEGEGHVLPRSALVNIIRPRVEEIFEMIRAKLEGSGLENAIGRQVVLTGGGSQLLGVRELASKALGRQVRLGKPHAAPGLAESVSGPAFSCALGMLQYAVTKPLEDRLREASVFQSGVGGKLKAVAGWLKQNF